MVPPCDMPVVSPRRDTRRGLTLQIPSARSGRGLSPGSLPPRLGVPIAGVFGPMWGSCFSNTPTPTRVLSCRSLRHVLSGPVERLEDNPDPAAVTPAGGCCTHGGPCATHCGGVLHPRS